MLGHHLGQDPHSYGFDSSGAVFHNRRRQRNRDARFGVNSVAGCVLRESCDSGFISSSKNSDDGSSSSASESSNVQWFACRLLLPPFLPPNLRSSFFIVFVWETAAYVKYIGSLIGDEVKKLLLLDIKHIRRMLQFLRDEISGSLNIRFHLVPFYLYVGCGCVQQYWILR